MHSIFAAAIVVLAVSPAFAEEGRVTRDQVPKAVLDAVIAKYPGAELASFEKEEENGATTYEISVSLAGAHLDVTTTDGGKLLVEERVIPLAELNAAVKKGFGASKFAKAKVLKVEKVTDFAKPDAPTYELLVEVGRQKSELLFTSAGHLDKTEAVTAGD